MSSGEKGELIPAATFEKIPRLANDNAAREDMRVVSLRIDPCFAALDPSGAAECQNQVRLIFQPTKVDSADASLNTQDAAVHAFYAMPRAELTALAKEILAAKRGARGSLRTPLGVHPLIEAQGLAGTFATDLKAAVLRHAGKANLTRLTFMTREPSRQPLWKFGGFDIAGARHTKMKVASMGEIAEQSFSTLGRNGQSTPAIQSPDDLSLFFRASSAQSATPAAVKKAFTAALRVQNPSMHSPDTVDCVSCHTTTSARIFAEKNANQSATDNPARFTSRFNVALTKSPAAERPDNLRAFGYLGTEVAISQRTANESAAVAEYVNAKILLSR